MVADATAAPSSSIFECGKPTWRAKKINEITSMRDGPDAPEVFDCTEWGKMILSRFTEKRKCNDIHNRSLIIDFLNKYDGRGVELRPQDIVNILKRVRRQKVLDHYGCSPMGMLIVGEVLPALV